MDGNEKKINFIEELSKRVHKAAKDALGSSLDRVILYGSYARGDYDLDSDIDFMIIVNASQEEASKERLAISKRLSGIDLEFDILVSFSVTSSAIFHQYAEDLPFYRNILREGVLIDG